MIVEFVSPGGGGYEREPDRDFSMFQVGARVRWLESTDLDSTLNFRSARGIITAVANDRPASRNGPLVTVLDLDTGLHDTRKSDDVDGLLTFQDNPRWYHSFKPQEHDRSSGISIGHF